MCNCILCQPPGPDDEPAVPVVMLDAAELATLRATIAEQAATIARLEEEAGRAGGVILDINAAKLKAEAKLAEVEAERDRQYEYNVEQVAAQAALEAKLAAAEAEGVRLQFGLLVDLHRIAQRMWQDIHDWTKTARGLRERSPQPDNDPACPSQRGIDESDRIIADAAPVFKRVNAALEEQP